MMMLMIMPKAPITNDHHQNRRDHRPYSIRSNALAYDNFSNSEMPMAISHSISGQMEG